MFQFYFTQVHIYDTFSRITLNVHQYYFGLLYVIYWIFDAVLCYSVSHLQGFIVHSTFIILPTKHLCILVTVPLFVHLVPY